MSAGRTGSIEVVDVPQRQRFEIRDGGEMVGLADYHLGDGTIDFVHTEVDHDRRNQGLASQLVRGALDDVRARHRFRVIASCSYVARWIDAHPDYRPLLASPPGEG
jgi:predicted GNAT family acetyltransferase